MSFSDYASKDKLKEPIRDLDALRAALGLHSDAAIKPTVTAVEGKTITMAQWWAWREIARIEHGVYECTEVLNYINERVPGVYAHVSQDDKSMVAYTPSREAGEVDKQIRTTLGKLIVKLFPLYTDDYVQKLVNGHNAEINTTVEWYTTGEEFQSNYNETFGSDAQACMSKQFVNQVHPVRVYESPEVKLAILRDDNRKIIARAFVREVNGSKGYIRCYGNPKLKAWLIKEGYKPTNWHGFKFKKFQYKDSRNMVVMPYLDGNGERGSSNVSTVAMIGGEIFCIDDKTQLALNKCNGYYATATSTDGYITLRDNPAGIFAFRDMATGILHNRLEMTGFSYTEISVYKGGESGIVLWRDDENRPEFLRDLTRCHDNTYADKVFMVGGRTYPDNPAARLGAGYAQLAAKFYGHLPENERWVRSSVTVATKEQEVILKSDAAQVFVKINSFGGVEGNQVHKSVIDKSYVKLHTSNAKDPDMYTQDLSLIRRTDTGRKVIVGVHNVIELWDGTLTFNRGVTHVNIASRNIPYKGDKPATLDVDGEYFTKAWVEWLEDKREYYQSHDDHDNNLNMLGAMSKLYETMYSRGQLYNYKPYLHHQPSNGTVRAGHWPDWNPANYNNAPLDWQFVKDCVPIEGHPVHLIIKTWLQSLGQWDQENGPVPEVLTPEIVIAPPGQVSRVPLPPVEWEPTAAVVISEVAEHEGPFAAIMPEPAEPDDSDDMF